MDGLARLHGDEPDAWVCGFEGCDAGVESGGEFEEGFAVLEDVCPHLGGVWRGRVLGGSGTLVAWI